MTGHENITFVWPNRASCFCVKDKAAKRVYALTVYEDF